MGGKGGSCGPALKQTSKLHITDGQSLRQRPLIEQSRHRKYTHSGKTKEKNHSCTNMLCDSNETFKFKKKKNFEQSNSENINNEILTARLAQKALTEMVPLSRPTKSLLVSGL